MGTGKTFKHGKMETAFGERLNTASLVSRREMSYTEENPPTLQNSFV